MNSSPTASTGGRDPLVDAARALSVCVVVLFHAGLWRVSLICNRWEAHTMDPGPIGWYGSWLLMVMPVFFIAGGFAHGVVIDMMHEHGTGLAHYYANRGRRLVGPTTVFVTFFAVPSTVAAWCGLLDEAVFVSHNLTKLLWFLVTYLLVVLLAPVMVWLQDHAARTTFAVLVGTGLVVDLWTMWSGNLDVRYLNLVFVWLACHQLGIAHQRGFLRQGSARRAWAAIAVGVAGIAALTHVSFGAMGRWPLPAIGMGTHWVSNLQPPTTAMTSLALAQTGVLGLLARRDLAVLRRPRVLTVTGTLNSLLMTIYLWHMPCVVLSFGIGIGLGLVWPSLLPVTTFPPSTLMVALSLMALVIPRVARLDLRMVPPLGPRQNGPVAAIALCGLTWAMSAVWRHGLVVHPSQPRSTLGVLGIWLGSAALAWSANRPACP